VVGFNRKWVWNCAGVLRITQGKEIRDPIFGKSLTICFAQGVNMEPQEEAHSGSCFTRPERLKFYGKKGWGRGLWGGAPKSAVRGALSFRQRNFWGKILNGKTRIFGAMMALGVSEGCFSSGHS